MTGPTTPDELPVCGQMTDAGLPCQNEVRHEHRRCGRHSTPLTNALADVGERVRRQVTYAVNGIEPR